MGNNGLRSEKIVFDRNQSEKVGDNNELVSIENPISYRSRVMMGMKLRHYWIKQSEVKICCFCEMVQ
jgi:hypothetical protein